MLIVHHGGILPSEEHMLPDTLPKLPFRYMFEDLQHDQYLLPESKTTVSDLHYIGTEAMSDPVTDEIKGIPVPAIHTFLAQFIDHDITLMDDRDVQLSLTNPTLLSPEEVKKIVNARSPNLDLDNVYGPNINPQFNPPDPDSNGKMIIEMVKHDQGFPDGVNDDGLHDFPRVNDKIPLIGDSRNAENLILAQLHIAFLRAHNRIVDKYHVGFDGAQKLLIQHYQWIVLNDFLPQICDADIVKRIMDEGPKFFPRPGEDFYMPLEFSVAAYRFGHSKVRPSYPFFNSIHKDGLFNFLFAFTNRRLLDDWVISWPSFLETDNKDRLPRRIDTTLSHPLLDLHEDQLNGHDITVGNLAVRNLLRGYMLRMPTGQAVAERMAQEIQGIKRMTPEEIQFVAEQIPILDNGTQADILKKTETNFFEKTPLWFYILAEAALYGQGIHLGPVGSTIVAEVLIGVLRNSTHSILEDPEWKGPTLGETPGKFDIADLLRLARVI